MAKPAPLVIFGAGELAEVAAFYFQTEDDRPIAAFTVDGAAMDADTLAGKPVVPFEDVTARFGSNAYEGFVAVGYSRVNGLRQEKCEALRAAGYRLASYVSRRATILGQPEIGDNAFILEDNTIQPFTRIGAGVTLWSGNHIGHHAAIGDYAFISSHVVVSGGVTIGARAFLGVNATLNDHIAIGARAVVGSGAVVTKDVPEEGVISTEPGKLAKIPSSRLRGF